MSGARPSLAEATRVWLRIGLTSFGGPAGQIALMHRVLVDEKRWIEDRRFLHALNYCMLLPGPEAQQLATYVGWLLHGRLGGLIAGILFVLPGFLLITALAALYVAFQDTAWLAAAFWGVKPAVLAVVLEALLRVSRRALKGRLAFATAAAAFLLLQGGVPFPLVILAAAGLGLLLPRPPAPLEPGGAEPAAAPGWRRSLRTLVLGLALWLGPVVAVALWHGQGHLFTAMGWFFAKMALVTFGGAYAVLTYVAQQAVTAHGWLTAGQMLDALGLAETTPGPLILVLSFVGFLAAAKDAGDPLLAGILGSAFVTYVTFAPSFLWIFLGAPYVERVRQNRALAAMLASVTAAVVGVIANLAVWFGVHVLFPGGLAGRPDLPALAIAALAALALLRLHWNLLLVLGLAAAAGLVVRLTGW